MVATNSEKTVQFPAQGYNLPDAGGHFGPFGGKYAPEVLTPALDQLERAYNESKADPEFQATLR
jgi:tryptophan synthase beta chain